MDIGWAMSQDFIWVAILVEEMWKLSSKLAWAEVGGCPKNESSMCEGLWEKQQGAYFHSLTFTGHLSVHWQIGKVTKIYFLSALFHVEIQACEDCK